MQRIIRENKEERARFEGLAHRTSAAVVNGDWEEFSKIIKAAGSDQPNDEQSDNERSDEPDGEQSE